MSHHDYETSNEDFGPLFVEFEYSALRHQAFVTSAFSYVEDGSVWAKSPFTPLQNTRLSQRLQSELLDKAAADNAERAADSRRAA